MLQDVCYRKHGRCMGLQGSAPGLLLLLVNPLEVLCSGFQSRLQSEQYRLMAHPSWHMPNGVSTAFNVLAGAVHEAFAP